MSPFNRFPRRRRQRPEAPVVEIEGPGTFDLAVVGESQYQEALERVAGGKTTRPVNLIVEAELVLEDDNPKDPLAVRVDIQGQTVGYLDRATARLYRKQSDEAGIPNFLGRCQAQIRGGWERPRSEGRFGVWLDIPMKHVGR